MGGAHRQASAPRRRKGGCRPLPHLAEPFLDSPTSVGGAQRQTSTPGRREVGDAGRRHTARSHSRTRPRRWEARTGKRSHLDEEKRGCQLSPHHTEPNSDSPVTVGGAHRQASTPRWREVVMPATATPSRAVLRLVRNDRRHTPASVRARMKKRKGAGRRHTLRSRSRTHLRRWEACTGNCPCMERERWRL
jgi:hypothetical protein